MDIYLNVKCGCIQIFLPLHDSEYLHWFLLVIDFEEKKLIYLDSLPSISAYPGRMRSIKILVKNNYIFICSLN